MDIPQDTPEVISYTCNLCGTANRAALTAFHRELSDCSGCGSTPRFRGIIHALSTGLFGAAVPLTEFPERKDIRGVGMSEWEGYAKTLADRFSFVNTFYHTEPRLDIMKEDWRSYTGLDFIICTEVFEHVLQPVSVGLSHLRDMLKSGGVLIFSVPFTGMPETKEHFPGLLDFGTCQINDQWVVVNRATDGGYQVFDSEVHFHGGPGTVLEMRLFGESHLMRMLSEAGFDTKVYSKPIFDIGYFWPGHEERAGAGRNRSYIIEARPRGHDGSGDASRDTP